MNQVTQAVYYLLDNNWKSKASNVDGRSTDVPKPQLVYAGERKKVSLSNNDVAYLRFGGEVSREAMGVGWKEELVTYEVLVDLRTVQGHTRLHGGRDANNNPEPYGGLSGEVERLCNNVRDGYAEFRSVDFYGFEDRTEQFDYGRWGGHASIRLKEFDTDVDKA